MLTPSKLIQLDGQQAQLPGTEVSLFRISYKQLIMILDKGNNFSRMYYRPKHSYSFGKAVLNCENLF